jgi:phosphopantothenoylcysteine decarboxylase/phosphopantothenate--cysteine ligase
MLAGKKIILGVTGGIAAYKAPLLVREFVKAGAEVQSVMTRAAKEFVTPLTLATLSRRDVISEMFAESSGETAKHWTVHIDLALWADIMLIAPATANVIGKIAHGFADDFLTTLVLALRCPLAIAPAMDVDMFLNKTVQQNIDTLRETGCFIIEPDEGELASGLSGTGRLPEIDRLVKFVDGILENSHCDLKGKKILVTAGPTYEPIDPVRFIGNYSSGKMGFAVANAAALRGADVTLVAGPVHLKTPRNVRRVDVRTAHEMLDAVDRAFDDVDAVVMAAAVADYTVANPAKEKIKREKQTGDEMSLTLKKNPDILKSLGEKKTNQVLVGFALETSDGVANAQDKLRRKNLDLIVLNNPIEEGAAFNSDTNIVTIISRNGTINELPRMSKFGVANQILDVLAMLLRQKPIFV